MWEGWRRRMLVSAFNREAFHREKTLTSATLDKLLYGAREPSEKEIEAGLDSFFTAYENAKAPT